METSDVEKRYFFAGIAWKNRDNLSHRAKYLRKDEQCSTFSNIQEEIGMVKANFEQAVLYRQGHDDLESKIWEWILKLIKCGVDEKLLLQSCQVL